MLDMLNLKCANLLYVFWGYVAMLKICFTSTKDAARKTW